MKLPDKTKSADPKNNNPPFCVIPKIPAIASYTTRLAINKNNENVERKSAMTTGLGNESSFM